MKIKNCLLLYGTIFLILIGLTFSCKQISQEEKNGFPVQKFKMTTDIPLSITTSDSVQTTLGMLRFFDGFPDAATVQKVYNDLDFQRGVQAFLAALPAALMYELRAGYRTFGPDNQTILIAETFKKISI